MLRNGQVAQPTPGYRKVIQAEKLLTKVKLSKTHVVQKIKHKILPKWGITFSNEVRNKFKSSLNLSRGSTSPVAPTYIVLLFFRK